ncbi:MAG: T9SS C-terminal target domain-containing protein [Bacteroidetes bacterium]|nr:MAG: T9SS C-terminal target domain-containing protein [Bacteroidota bacterium]
MQTVTVTMQVDVASLCYVTSDEVDYTKNRVYINNIDGQNVESYEVLRETSTNVFTSMGTIASGESSFLDETSNNTTQTYRYSVRTTDICQNTAPQSPVHTTMLLQSNVAANNSINLNWNTYHGVGFGNFEIYRRINNGSFELLATLPASNTMYNDTQANVQENSYEYYVAIQVDPCGTKLSAVQIRSNREAVGAPVGIESGLLQDQVVLYPNPSSGMVYLQTPDWLFIEEVKLYNPAGHFIDSYKQNDAINIENLSPGVYFVQIITEQGIITRKLTKK